MKINYKKLYEDRLEVVKQDMKTAYRQGEWSRYSKLRKEKQELEGKIGKYNY